MSHEPPNPFEDAKNEFIEKQADRIGQLHKELILEQEANRQIANTNKMLYENLKKVDELLKEVSWCCYEGFWANSLDFKPQDEYDEMTFPIWKRIYDYLGGYRSKYSEPKF
jgi:hypothetical protein